MNCLFRLCQWKLLYVWENVYIITLSELSWSERCFWVCIVLNIPGSSPDQTFTFYQSISPRTVQVGSFVLSIIVHWADDKIRLSLKNKTETLTLDQSPSSWRRKRRSLWSPGKICRHGGIQRCPAQCPGCRRWSCLWRGGRVRTASSWERCPPQPVFWSRPADGVTRHSPEISLYVIQDSGWDWDECY